MVWLISLTCRLIAAMSRDSDVSPFCVVGISQTLLSGTGLYHFLLTLKEFYSFGDMSD